MDATARVGTVRTAIATAVGVALIGVPIGLIWSGIAPRAQLVASAGSLDYADSETKAFITADAYLLLLCLAGGVLAAGLVWALARRRGPATLVALGLGAAAASLVAARVGVHGTTRAQLLAAARAGRLPALSSLPLQVHAHAVLLALPGAALLTWAGLVLRLPSDHDRSPSPEPEPDPG